MPVISMTKSMPITTSRQSTAGNWFFNTSYHSRKIDRNVTANPNRFAFFRQNGYLPVVGYTAHYRECEYQLGAVQTKQTLPPGYTGEPYTGTLVCDFYTQASNLLASTIRIPVSDPAVQSLRARAIARANSRARGQQAGLGETMAEIQKTANMVANTATRIASAARAVRRGQFMRASNILGISTPVDVKGKGKNSFASNWLAYRYGWVPLASQVDGVMKALYDHLNRPHVARCFGRVSDTKVEKTTISYGTSHGHSDVGMFATTNMPSNRMNWKVHRELRHTMSYQVVYIYKVTNPTLALGNGLGLADPVTLAWELVPLSFIADWFLNVGDVLEQLGAFTGKQLLAVSETYTCRSTQTGRISDLTSTDRWYKHTILDAPKYTRSDTYTHRVVGTLQPTFGLHLENGLNLRRLVDAVALLHQRLR